MEKTNKNKPVIKTVGRGRIKKSVIDWSQVHLPLNPSPEDLTLAKEWVEDNVFDTVEEGLLLLAASDAAYLQRQEANN